ncbi:ATP-binding SpoIIE family protein phosphatase [Streptomyces naphthomycinicus]|uniref:ATP-binding SpoIIE family protein phosphatase n=1 Tax=Streptomyces naphthomycinicus TaxID=2872625 RepID=UPI001CEC66BE|nr:SpoIIE family protein phosphatase [Streptomyces sp. TML10]
MTDHRDVYGTLHRDTALAATLQEVIEELGANTGLAYLLSDDGRTLRSVIIGGAQPAIFTMPERLDIDDPYATAAALRTGDMAMAGFPTPACLDLRLASRIPFPYSVVSLPLGIASGPLGVLTFLWVPPRTRFLHAQDVAWLKDKTQALGRTLQAMADRAVDMRPGTKPVLLPLYRRKSRPVGSANTGWGLPDFPGSTEVSFMYQVHQLAAELNEATSVADVMAVTRARIMTPFGAGAFLVSTLRDGRLWVAGHSGYPTVALRLLHGAAAGPQRPDADALLTRTPLFFEDRHALVQSYPSAVEDGLEASVHLPIVLSNRQVGVCTLGFRRPQSFSSEERAVAMMMMDLLGPALERASLGESARSLAESLQKKLLPRDLVEVPGMVTTARYVPAPSTAGLGGDWYDMVPLPGGRIALVVGDVEGHSIDSCVVMGQLRSAVRAYASEGHSPGIVMTRANRLLCELDTDLMATCCLISFDATTGVAETALAGHPPPLVRAADGTVTTLQLPANVPLGVEAGALYTVTDIALARDALLMLYTDGLTESRQLDTALWARTLLAPPSVSLEKLADHVIEQACTQGVHRDDVALLLARYEGPQAGPNRRITRKSFHRHDLHAVKAARQFVSDSLHQWGLDEMIDSFQLVTSEMVTNALIHADSDVDLRLREYPDHLRLEVRDADPTPPVPAPITLTEESNEYAEHGRGLVIVDALCSEWGNSPSGRGKTVWVDVYNNT